MAERFLDKVYAARSPEETRALYDAWSASYDAEILENGYATPARAAQALAGAMADKGRPVLDFGCGTGISGQALRAAGFTVLDGMDLSAEMLKGAAAKGVYRALMQIGEGGGPPALPGDYAAIAAIGVIGPGAAPLSVLGDLVAALAPGGLLVFSLNDHALEDAAFGHAVAELTGGGTMRQLSHDYGPHLPGRGLGSAIWVLERL